jgi:hypothetical protein
MRPLALRAFYDRVKAENPHILLVTGDIGESNSVAQFVTELAQIAPIYFVLGNHDYYRSSIASVRAEVQRLDVDGGATWLPAQSPLRLTPRVVMLGVDGWGDARCGDVASTVQLSDWNLIDDFRRCRSDPAARIEVLQRLGNNEARALADLLSRAPPSEQLLVLTHVPPFPEACVYDGQQSDPAWLPWFTCIATGEVLARHARANPSTMITVLCGHSHGAGTFRPEPNLEVRTGGWPPGVEGYGNPIVQHTLEL